MKLDELTLLAKQGESKNLEFKKTTGQRTAAAKTVCAFLNGHASRHGSRHGSRKTSSILFETG